MVSPSIGKGGLSVQRKSFMTSTFELFFPFHKNSTQVQSTESNHKKNQIKNHCLNSDVQGFVRSPSEPKSAFCAWLDPHSNPLHSASTPIIQFWRDYFQDKFLNSQNVTKWTRSRVLICILPNWTKRVFWLCLFSIFVDKISHRRFFPRMFWE